MSANAGISFIRFHRQWGGTVAASTEDRYERNSINAKQNYRNQIGETFISNITRERNITMNCKSKTEIKLLNNGQIIHIYVMHYIF